jgi:UTP-glucose-1-phosphate uridylyltransferase
MKKVILYGTPFKNRETIQLLLQDCIDEIDEECAKQVIDNATINKESGITVITCDEHKAFQYCQNLVENGLDAIIE